MKSLLVLQLLGLLASSVQAFQFMKGLKMPTYDPHEEAIKERFGDKSTFCCNTSFKKEITKSHNLLSLFECRIGGVDWNLVRTGAQNGESIASHW